MTRSQLWCELALIDGSARHAVAITVEDGRFLAVEPGSPAPAGATRLPGLTVPGLANAHSHAFHRALRSRTHFERGSFWTWRELMYRAAERLTPDSYHRLARATFGEMAVAGVTAVGEFHYVHHQPDGRPYADPNEMADAVLSAADEVGIRITLLDTLYLHGGLSADGYAPPQGVQRRYSDGTVEAWAERVEAIASASRAVAQRRIGAAIHSVRAVDPDSIRAAARWAAAEGVPLHAHVSEQTAENDQCVAHHGVTPTRLLADAGALDERFTAIHATHVTDGDIDLLAASGSTVCVCPTTERDLGDGIGPTAELARAGVGLAVGSDSHAVIDVLAEARAVELDARARCRARGIHSPAELMAMATVDGHASLGWTDAGAIAPGRRADLVTIALDTVRTAGSAETDAAGTALFAATAADVTHVVVDGEPIVTDGRHTTIDVAAELEAAIGPLVDR